MQIDMLHHFFTFPYYFNTQGSPDDENLTKIIMEYLFQNKWQYSIN